MIKNIFIAILVLLCSSNVMAQKLSVESFVPTTDAIARTRNVKGTDGNVCAAVVVRIPSKEATFNGGFILNKSTYKDGEYILDMQTGAAQMRVSVPGYNTIDVKFRDYIGSTLQSKTTYLLTINMPQVGMPIQQDNGLTYFILSVQPKNAQVTIDGKLQVIDPNGEYSLLLPRTDHTYSVSAGGYATKTETFTLGMERKSLKVSLESTMASLSVTTETSGASIFVNEQKKGTTSWTGTLQPGNYSIEARLDGYYPHSETVALSERQQKSITIPALIARTGSLDVSYRPNDSEVWIDGKKAGLSPDIFKNLLIGSHKVSIRKEGYTSKELTVSVSEGQTSSLTGTLEKTVTQTTSSGNAKELYNKGVSYYKQQNYTEAVKYYRQAADMGYASAQCYLGYCYEEGQGVSQDYSQAVYWYRKSADQGNATAQYDLGCCYGDGHGVSQDYSQAVYWYRKAVDQGYAIAQCKLGYCYEKGQGVSQDYSQAVYWYRKAADQGNASAQCNLGYCYNQGLGVAQDYSQAVYWYRKAADQGNATAQYNMGQNYYYGNGVTIDKRQAKLWYEKAAAQGDEDAKKKLQELTF